MLQPYVFAAVRQPRLGCLHIGFGLRQLGPIVAIVDAEQNIARPDGLIVPHRDRNDISAPLPPHTHAPSATLAAATHSSMPIFFRSEEHTSELQSLMRISYAVFCLKTKNQHT